MPKSRDQLFETLTTEGALLPFFQELGYGRLSTAKPFEFEGRRYSISHIWQNTPIHLVSLRADLDQRVASGELASRENLEVAKRCYREHYSMTRLRRMSLRLSGTQHHDHVGHGPFDLQCAWRRKATGDSDYFSL